MELQSVKKAIKLIIYQVAKLLGLFQLALKLTIKRNRILCYHGGSIQDEHLFWPGVFITAPVLKRHLLLIQKYKFNVISLNEFENYFNSKTLPKKSLVLTFDDGFYSTQQIIEPILKKANYKATLYVTTHYVTHQSPIFPITLAYLFFKTKRDQIKLSLPNKLQVLPTKGVNLQKSLDTIYNFSQTLNEEDQNQLLISIGKQLEVNTDLLFEERLFHNLNAEELKQMHERGTFDIQLHTHRHNLPIEGNFEIEKNRDVLSTLTGKDKNTLVHFCYPSGKWSPEHYKLLNQLKIRSATTLDYGVNDIKSNFLSLKRILCTNDKPLIIFEAELTGFDLLLKNVLKRIGYKFKRVNESVTQDA